MQIIASVNNHSSATTIAFKKLFSKEEGRSGTYVEPNK
jgi:hypothetical protein